jgi:hypothetical protein
MSTGMERRERTGTGRGGTGCEVLELGMAGIRTVTGKGRVSGREETE